MRRDSCRSIHSPLRTRHPHAPLIAPVRTPDRCQLPLKNVKTKESGFGIWGVTLPYVIVIAAQLPMLLLYFSQLWNRPHYQFFPIALIMVAAFAWIRWPRNEPQPFFASTFSSAMFGAGLLFGLLGTLFAEPWLAAASMVFLMTSLFARTRDGEFPSKSLIALALPLFVILSLPRNLDFKLITWLQLVSSKMSSWYLDLLNFKHYSPGTTLNFPEQAYEVERACSGVQSFFTLLFCATFIIIALRRGFCAVCSCSFPRFFGPC